MLTFFFQPKKIKEETSACFCLLLSRSSDLLQLEWSQLRYLGKWQSNGTRGLRCFSKLSQDRFIEEFECQTCLKEGEHFFVESLFKNE